MRYQLPITRKQLLSASGLALATALVAAGPALRAQSFQGTPISTFGNVSIFATLSATDVTVSSPSAVINWVPNDTNATGGPINFQPTGTTATFRNNPDLTSDFTVLNRIVPSGSTRPIQFNGNVVSRLQTQAGQVTGGTVFFYSPGGILIGSSGVFDVGNLVLTASDLAYDASGNFGSNGQYVFQQATVAGAPISLAPGAQVNAPTDGSYVAMIAPYVSNAGTINVNGSAALVAADAASIQFSPNGLFSIQIDSGSSASGIAIQNTGSIGGPAASNVTQFHRIYMVAVPKNDALTMLIGAGSPLGFDVAGAADVVGNAIVLSGGKDIISGDAAPKASNGGGTGFVNIQGSDADVTSSFRSASTGVTQFFSSSSAGLDFASDVAIQGGAGGPSLLLSQANGAITIGGGLTIDTSVAGDDPAISAQGGQSILSASSGNISVQGSVTLIAEGQGAQSTSNGGAAGAGVGGLAEISATDGGSIAIGGSALLQARGIGGAGDGVAGGSGQGGTAQITAFNADASIAIGGDINLVSSGIGQTGTIGGAGRGGATTLMSTGTSQISVAGSSAFSATGSGSSGTVSGGDGRGGSMGIVASNDASITLHGVDAFLDGSAGSGPGSAGAAYGGIASVRANLTSSTTAGAPGTAHVGINGDILVNARALGGAATAAGGTDAAIQGGSVVIDAASGNRVDVAGLVSVDASAFGSSGYGNGNAALGGTITVRGSSGGTVALAGGFTADADAFGGVGVANAAGGNATGGTVNVTTNGGSVQLTGPVQTSAEALGGLQSGSGLAGSGQGGTNLFTSSNLGQLVINGSVSASVSGFGGTTEGAGQGGAGIGGAIQVSSSVGSTGNISGNVTLVANGLGGGGQSVLTGGLGRAGDISIRIFGNAGSGGFGFGSALALTANGTGGESSGSAGTGGNGIAGTVTMLADGAPIVISESLQFNAAATGGNGFANGGLAFGGSGSVEARNAGSIAAQGGTSLDLVARGGSSFGMGSGGAASGANITLAANTGQVTSAQAISISGGAAGGAALSGTGSGGAATANVITVATSGNGLISAASSLNINAGGVGGNSIGGLAGSGSGATARLSLSGGQFNAGSLLVDVRGVGGQGNLGGGAGAGGSVSGNIASTGLTIGTSTQIYATGAGGSNTSNSGSGVAGTGTGGSVALSFSRSTANLGSSETVLIEASGFAGEGGAAQGTGGNVSISAAASTVSTTGSLAINATGGGSTGKNGTAGGVGKGGTISLSALGDPQGPSAINAGVISLSSDGIGGVGSRSLVIGVDSGAGGAAEGGNISLAAAVDGGSILADGLFASARGFAENGGAGFRNPDTGAGKGGQGGAAKGGVIIVGSLAATGGSGSGGYTLGAAEFDAGARGGFGGDGDDGFVPGQAGDGGSAMGGSIQMQFDQGGSAISVSEILALRADAVGGNSGICGAGCVGAGGTATGGTINFGSGGLSTGNTIALGELSLSAIADGGGSYSPTGGSASGGGAFFRIGSGTDFTAGTVSITTEATGGDQFAGGTGGSGTGGNSSFIASGTGAVTIDGTLTLLSTGQGGNGRDIGGIGGAGTGGTSRLYSDGGRIAIGGGTVIVASGFGGQGDQNSPVGTGGAGTGGTALLTVGTPDVIGNLGRIDVGGLAQVIAEGTGGDSGTGGLAIGGFAGISARQGQLSLDLLLASASASGGYGQFGGAGGEAQGGRIEVFANSATQGASLVTMNALVADSSASGGFGGDSGRTANGSGAGGAGGMATGGSIAIFGTAGNGTMQVGSIAASADGVGGGGGAGLIGGNGGRGLGGSIQVGTASGIDTGTLNAGSATYGSIEISTSGHGGTGGTGDSVTGTGGNGGDATGGGALLLVRGSPVSITGNASFEASALGGSAGTGSASGRGGNAEFLAKETATQIVGAELVVTNRFQQPLQRGALTAPGSLTFAAQAVGGDGLVRGTSLMRGSGVDMQVVNSSVDVGNLSFIADAASADLLSAPGSISLVNSTATVAGAFSLVTPGRISLSLDQANLTAASVSIAAADWVLPTSAPTAVGTLSATNQLSLVSGRDLVGYANLSSQGPLTLQAPGRIDFGSLFALGAIDVTAGGTLTLGNVQSGDAIDLDAQGALVAGNLVAATSASVGSGGSVTLGNIAAGTGTPSGSNGGLYSVGIRAAGDVRTGTIFAASDIGIAMPGALTTGNLRGYDALLLAGGNVAIDSMAMVNRVLVANATMASLGETATGFDKERVFAALAQATGGAVTIANTANATSLRIAAGTTIAAGNIAATGPVGLTSSGTQNLAGVNAGFGRIELISGSSSITATNLFTGSDILVSAGAGLTLGSVRGRDVALLSGGNVTVQSVLAGVVFDPQTSQVTNAVGRLLIGNTAMLPVTAMPGSIDYATLLTATPIRTGGNVTITGGAIVGRLRAAAGGDLTGGGIRGFGGIEVESGGLVTVAQRWGAPEVQIVSADISIIDNGTATGATGQQILSGIRTIDTGSVDLISNSARTTLIGDGLTGSGYALSAAEIGLVSTGTLLIAAVDQAANPTDMLVGNLTLTAGGAIGASVAAGTTGRVILASGNSQTQTPGGAIRVVGTINGTGFGQGNVLEFTTGRFELDAGTGAITLTSAAQPGTGSALGGVVEINAANIHVGSAAILDRLAADPFYAGRIADLNAPAVTPRPDGVLRALGLDLSPTGTLYIQNTGTALNPAGFFSDIAFTDVNAPAGAAPGSLSVVVNGAFQTSNGIVTGSAAHDLVVNDPEANLTAFSADSQLNGCAFNLKACTMVMEGADPVASIAGQIAIIATATLGSTPAFVEEPAAAGGDPDSDDPAQEQQPEQASEGEAAASSPIAPPPQLIDSRPLDTSSQIEQPVSGSGNPALIGSVVNEDSVEGDIQ